MKNILPALVLSLALPIMASLAVEVAPGAPRPIPVESQKAVIENEGLWPNLIHGPNNTLFLSSFNKPKHGAIAGEVDGWISKDEGKTWTRSASIEPRPDEVSNRMNHAIGLVDNGTRLVAAISGYTKQGINSTEKWTLIPSVVCASTDGGKSWSKIADLDPGLQPLETIIPFGPVIQAHDGSVRFAAYHREASDRPTSSYMLSSRDGGKTWGIQSKIGESLNETILIRLGDNEWIAMARTAPADSPNSGELRQFRSTDDGSTWVDEGLVTQRNEHPASLIKLKDGRLLLSYSIRTYGAIVARLSEDNGASWGAALEISSYKGDGGYPYSVQLSDGSILTAFYAQKSPSLGQGLESYHTGLVNWSLP